MERHIVKMSDFVDLAFDDNGILNSVKHEIASSSGRGHRKSLKVVTNIVKLSVSFEISNSLTKTTAYALRDAVALYNELD